MEEGGWRMEDGGWRVEDGGWRMEDGGWRVEDGGWRRMHLLNALESPLGVFLWKKEQNDVKKCGATSRRNKTPEIVWRRRKLRDDSKISAEKDRVNA